MREIWIFLIDHLPFLTSVLDVIKSIYDIKAQKKKGDDNLNFTVVGQNIFIVVNPTIVNNHYTTSDVNRKVVSKIIFFLSNSISQNRW